MSGDLRDPGESVALLLGVIEKKPLDAVPESNSCRVMRLPESV
jgi:hypothetical protein